MEGIELWKVVGVFGAVFLIFVVILLTARKHPVDRANRSTGRDKFYSQQGYTRENKKDDNRNTIIVVRDNESKKNDSISIIDKSSEVVSLDKSCSTPKSSGSVRESMKNTDALKVIFGSPSSGKTFKDHFSDTSALEKIFGKPKSSR